MGRRHLLQRQDLMLPAGGRHVEPGHPARTYRSLSPRSAPRGIRRRARPEDARVPGEDRPAQQFGKNPQAGVRRGRQKRPARPLDRIAPDARQAEEQRNSDVVPDRQRRRPRLRQKEEPGLSVLRDDHVRENVSAGGSGFGYGVSKKLHREGATKIKSKTLKRRGSGGSRGFSGYCRELSSNLSSLRKGLANVTTQKILRSLRYLCVSRICF